MKTTTSHESTLDHVLNLVLRIGLTLSCFTVMIGGALFLWQHANDNVDSRIFNGEPASLKGIESIFIAAYRDQSLAIIQLGIILLIATPLIRVFSCILVFLKERDFLYVALASFVLGVLIFSFI